MMFADLDGLVGFEMTDVGSKHAAPAFRRERRINASFLVYLIPESEFEELAVSGCPTLHEQ